MATDPLVPAPPAQSPVPDGPLPPDPANRRRVLCPLCAGSGLTAASPVLTLVFPSGERVSTALDVADLVSSGACPLEVYVESYARWGQVVVRADVEGWLGGLLSSRGWSLDRCLPQRGRYAGIWALELPNLAFQSRFSVSDDGYRAVSGGSWEVQPANNSASGPPTPCQDLVSTPGLWVSPDVVLDRLACSVARFFAGRAAWQVGESPQARSSRVFDELGVVVASDGTVAEQVVVVRPRETFEELLGRLWDAAPGWQVGFRMGFVATGETGPTVCLADSSGALRAELACDYEWVPAMFDALGRVPEALSRLSADGSGAW